MDGVDSDRAIYTEVIQRARERGIEHAIGGGMAVGVYTVHRQSTKDLDLYVQPGDRERMIELVHECGLKDYYDVHPYDRHWIYRSHRGEVIVDIMWGMPNRRAEVDGEWLRRGRWIDFHGEQVRVLPLEELIWAKLYVLQRDRCDWPDIINLIHAAADAIDWDHLVRRVGDDAPLLGSVLTVYRWLAPGVASRLPRRLWRGLAESVRRNGDGIPRADLLDTRPWFIDGKAPEANGK